MMASSHVCLGGITFGPEVANTCPYEPNQLSGGGRSGWGRGRGTWPRGDFWPCRRAESQEVEMTLWLMLPSLPTHSLTPSCPFPHPHPPTCTTGVQLSPGPRLGGGARRPAAWRRLAQEEPKGMMGQEANKPPVHGRQRAGTKPGGRARPVFYFSFFAPRRGSGCWWKAGVLGGGGGGREAVREASKRKGMGFVRASLHLRSMSLFRRRRGRVEREKGEGRNESERTFSSSNVIGQQHDSRYC